VACRCEDVENAAFAPSTERITDGDRACVGLARTSAAIGLVDAIAECAGKVALVRWLYCEV
jgi:hypothetical protein